tara:strand:+ start:4431 stop:4751 length:321 start_codon:yes stop_codon:yes gene_type:complete
MMSESIFGKELTEADYQEYAEEDQNKWVTYGPRGLVAEAKGLALADGIDLAVAMTACVESKRNYELQMIRMALSRISADTKSLSVLNDLAASLDRIDYSIDEMNKD